ncbi:Ina17p CYBJADRAFT_168056 [Cyberlindnera jadinii NRRL Y-1542]|uniref:Uncharacterized protein n=1 Tax=Cyberlindnera jadinii (strain ATCC 18201 / CBS 1600 / BCRC 20928 / JCM 3617 / NBRC 0987 / NRRL Y-1542) TaxID=983966 RepID=A0A1E4S0H5_CYBJN|nr:hypothetical protein CYBJADRAFT_168056 [Cyberlindnera jadinii NRRL Y-1542]ODV72987.1 hypothetical protein CYBJADRAFT_168056 [Cyberlindnera jadinii NRRL Y-1542]
MRQLLATARDSARALSTGSALWNKNAQDIDRLNSMIRQKLLEMEELEKKRIEDAKKPKLADFTRPILLTLGISSIVYFSYHLLWWNLEYDEREAVLKELVREKELELQGAIEEQQASAPACKPWYRRLRLW